MTAMLALPLVGCQGEEPTVPQVRPPANEVVPGNEAKPDVLLVVLDTLRADAVGAYGQQRPTTPNLDAFAKRGVLWEEAHVSGTWSRPSHASLFTGTPPWVHGAHFLLEHGGSRLREDLPTLAERFADAGYTTVSVSANPNIDYGTTLERGFETAIHDSKDEVVLRHVQAGLQRQRDAPLFLFVNLMSPHAPYQPCDAPWLADYAAELSHPWLTPYRTDDGGIKPGQGPTMRETAAFRIARGDLVFDGEMAPARGLEAVEAVYHCDVRRADQLFGELLALWRAAGRDPIIAVTSDHGEGFGEHGQLDHGRSVWPELTHVPLVISAPSLPPGERQSSPTMTEGIYGTLLELAGLGRADDPTLDDLGFRFAMAWPDHLLFSHHVGGRYEHESRLVADERHAWLRWHDLDQIFDLRDDPGMIVPIEDHAARQRLRRLAAEHEAFVEKQEPVPMQLSPTAEARLRALGYVP